MSEAAHDVFFGTSMFEVMNPGHAELQGPLVETLRARQARATTAVESGVAERLKRRLYETDFDLLRDEHPSIVQLREFFQIALESALAHISGTGRVDVAYEIHECWAHLTGSGGFHDQHAHIGNFWCGIYYVDIAECDLDSLNGVNRFYAPFPNYFHPATGREVSFIDVRPQDGKLVLFPAYLQHSALPYHGERERIVIAFNSRLL